MAFVRLGIVPASLFRPQRPRQQIGGASLFVWFVLWGAIATEHGDCPRETNQNDLKAWQGQTSQEKAKTFWPRHHRPGSFPPRCQMKRAREQKENEIPSLSPSPVSSSQLPRDIGFGSGLSLSRFHLASWAYSQLNWTISSKLVACVAIRNPPCSGGQCHSRNPSSLWPPTVEFPDPRRRQTDSSKI